MTADEAIAALQSVRERHAPTLAADVGALNAFQRVHFVAWACRMAHPSGTWEPTLKPAMASRPPQRRVTGGSGARALEFRAEVDRLMGRVTTDDEVIADPMTSKAERLALAQMVLAAIGYEISNEDSILAAVGRKKAPIVVPMDEDDPAEQAADSWAA